MAYRHDLQELIGFIRAIDRITLEAKKQPNMTDRAGLYQVIMWELLESNYHNDTAKIEFYREIEQWARSNAERLSNKNTT